MVKMPHWPKPIGYKPIDLGLERVNSALDRLDHPELKLPPVVHIAGTNGKGSVLAYIRSVMETAGYKVHIYTSPHLVEFNERIVLAGEPISDSFLHEVLEETRRACEDVTLTFFEATTIAALLAFSKVNADIVLLETGMGGRLDATNIIPSPAVTCITPVGLDHMSYLGDTIERIAGEKAGIIKEGVPVVCSQQSDAALKVIKDKAKERGAPLVLAKPNQNLPTPGLKGKHQYLNVATAIECIKQLKSLDISDEDIERGVAEAYWPARLQSINSGVLAEKAAPHELWLDGGHNEAAATILADQINEWQRHDFKPIYLVVGMLADKDHDAFLSRFKDCDIESCIAVPIPNEPNAVDAASLKDMAKPYIDSAEASSISKALETIQSKAAQPSRVLVCGSLYLAGAFIEENNSLMTKKSA